MAHQRERDHPGRSAYRESTVKRTNGMRATPAGSETKAPDDRHQPTPEDGALAQPRNARSARSIWAGPMWNLAPCRSMQLEPPAPPDRIGDPRSDHRAEHACKHYADEREVVLRGALSRVCDRKAGEQHHDLRRDRDACAADRHQGEDAWQARIAHEMRRFVDERSRRSRRSRARAGNDSRPGAADTGST